MVPVRPAVASTDPQAAALPQVHAPNGKDALAGIGRDGPLRFRADILVRAWLELRLSPFVHAMEVDGLQNRSR
jgi:hypothetical protein